MADIIASTYEVITEIGSGGGGVVFLARHLRLDKMVVLKADKRKLTTRPDVLRREADAMKNLSHTYIPQVYDFFTEGDTVYTVMDYIEGESLDKPLKRGVRFPQPQVVQWACKLLEALSYLHSPIHGKPPRGYIHSDIKPANVMLTTYGDIRLIDFNIALAIGEVNVAGRSAGYASPEHYGLDFSTRSGFTTAAYDAPSMKDTAGGASAGKVIVPDIRSDIYSLGATLYHFLLGKRPAKDAIEVDPLPENEVSPQIIRIISKAMNPNPDLRYQTADEMLYAFTHLRENDPRLRRHKIIRAAVGITLAVFFTAGLFSSFIGLKRMEATQSALALAEYSENALREGNVRAAIDYALQALPESRNIFTPPYTAQAQKALTEALGLYDLSDGYKAHLSVRLPGGVIKLAVSPGGTTAAALTLGVLTVFDAAMGNKIAELPAADSALADAIFMNDTTIVYAGTEGVTVYDITARQSLWFGDKATTIAVSADGSTIAAVYRDENSAAIYAADGSSRYDIDFGNRGLYVAVNDRLADPKDNLFALNADGTLLAVSFADGGLEIFNLADRNDQFGIFEKSNFTRFEGGFNGKYFVFLASFAEETLFAVIDTETREQTDFFSTEERVNVTADEGGVYLAYRNKRTKYDPATREETDPGYGGVLPLYGFEYNIDSPDVKITRLESGADKEVFAYDSFYDHYEARISEDGQTVMLFSIYGFRLYKITGEIITEVSLEGDIYDQQFHKAESCLEVIWYDGTVRLYSANDGAIISEGRIAPPDESLYEEFFTETLRITAPLHKAPTAYDRKSGKLIRELEKDASLTYVTQVGEYVIAEYTLLAEGMPGHALMAEGSRFGLLMNKKCETLARLPNLCDIAGDELIFNDYSGSLRKTRIYHIDEIIGMVR